MPKDGTSDDRAAVQAPDEWSLTKSEAAIFRVLLAEDVATKDALRTALYGDSPVESTGSTLKVFIHSIRRKVGKFGVNVKTVYAVGYALDQRLEVIESLAVTTPQ